MYEDIHPPPAHACNVSCTHRTISVDSETATHYAVREALEVLRSVICDRARHAVGRRRCERRCHRKGTESYGRAREGCDQGSLTLKEQAMIRHLVKMLP